MAHNYSYYTPSSAIARRQAQKKLRRSSNVAISTTQQPTTAIVPAQPRAVVPQSTAVVPVRHRELTPIDARIIHEQRTSLFGRFLNVMIVLLTAAVFLSIALFFGIGLDINDQNEIIELGSIDSYDLTPRAKWLYVFDFSNMVKVDDGGLDINTPDSYHVTYTLFGQRHVKNVRIMDTQEPVITLNGKDTIVVQKFDDFSEPGYTATDNHDGDITKNVTFSVGIQDPSTYIVHYQVKDSSNNLGTAERTVKLAPGIPENQTIICLTFDDGPNSDITPQVLDILKANSVKATFFLTYYNDTNAAIVQRAYDEGHTLGIHGYSHKYSEIYASLDALIQNFRKMGDRIRETTFYSPVFIRFPGGSSNTVSRNYCEGIMTVGTQEVEKWGYRYVDWNVDSNDAGGADTSAEIYANVVNNIIPGKTNVVLMHDSYGHQASVDALQQIIDYCIDHGYVFLPITDDTPVVHHRLNN